MSEPDIHPEEGADVAQTERALIPYLNRLCKRHRHFRKWAAREGIGAWRAYDRDIPDFPFTVDVYEAGVVLSVFKEEVGEGRVPIDLPSLVRLTAEVCNVTPETVFLKRRERQKGASQYAPLAGLGRETETREGSLRFLVNLSDYLDTGLFLDHRPWRARLFKEAAGLEVLNLFCYTGSLSVAALAGGAAHVTSVDLSNTYLDWAQRNVALNGLPETAAEFIRADVREWLVARPRRTYDLILLDPPSFSNSKAMRGTLDIQRDHTDLLETAVRHLAPAGQMWFATNRRGFRLDSALGERFIINDTTARSVPPDFPYSKPHKSFEMARK